MEGLLYEQKISKPALYFMITYTREQTSAKV